jgi:hypothetical protein
MFLTLALALAATQPVRLAELGFTRVNVSEEIADFFSAHFALKLNERGLKVATRKEMLAVLGAERQRQLLTCDESRCMAELTDALGADGLLSGQLAKIGSRYQLDVRVLDAAGKGTLYSRSVSAKSDEGLLDELETLAESTATEVALKFGRPLPEKPASGIPTATWIAGGGGLVLAAAGAGLVAASRADLTAIQQADPQTDPMIVAAFRDAGKTKQSAGFALVAVGAAAVAAGVVIAIVSPRGPVVTPTVSANGAGVMISGTLP